MLKIFVFLCCVVYVYSQAQGDCPDVDGAYPVYLPDAKYCGTFYECSVGKPYKIECAPGTYFDLTKKDCDFDVDCGERIRSTVAPSTDAGTTESFTVAPSAATAE